MSTKPTIIFIYNANGGLLNGAIDAVHKLVSPATYACQLCAITYGHLGMRRPWKEFLESLKQSYTIQFLYKEDLKSSWAPLANEPLPAVWLREDDNLKLLISHEQFNGLNDLDKLTAFLIKQLAR